MFIILGVAGVCCLGFIGLAVFGGVKLWGNFAPQLECVIAFTEVQTAVLDYADKEGHLPNAEKWQDEVAPYLKSLQEVTGKDQGPFKAMAPDVEWCCENPKSGRTGMAFNAELSGKKLSEIKNPESTALIFEVEKVGRNLTEPYKPRPQFSSPQILGEHRGWIVMSVQRGGEMGGVQISGPKKKKFGARMPTE